MRQSLPDHKGSRRCHHGRHRPLLEGLQRPGAGGFANSEKTLAELARRGKLKRVATPNDPARPFPDGYQCRVWGITNALGLLSGFVKASSASVNARSCASSCSLASHLNQSNI